MKPIKIIPARFDSKRLPGKLLLRKNSKSLLQHVYENTQADYVATSDSIIIDEVKRFGGKVIKTSDSPQNGTERVAEAIKILDPKEKKYDDVVNIQGDEPNIDVNNINFLLARYYDCTVDVIHTFIAKKINANFFDNNNQVKCISNVANFALYFSRQNIPGNYHIGVYCYPRHVLKDIVKVKDTYAMKKENLEQLKFIELGYNVRVILIDKQPLSINTKEDYEEWLKQ